MGAQLKFAANVEDTQGPPLRMFYFDHRTGEDVGHPQPVPATREQVIAKMTTVLDTLEKNFVGVVALDGNVLQFAPNLDGAITLDIPVPPMRASWQAKFSFAECCAFVAALGATVDIRDYPGLTSNTWDAKLPPSDLMPT